MELTIKKNSTTNTIKVQLFLAANSDWPLHQLNVKNAFLGGDLEDKVYMEIPPGFEIKKNVSIVCKLSINLQELSLTDSKIILCLLNNHLKGN